MYYSHKDNKNPYLCHNGMMIDCVIFLLSAKYQL